MTVDTPASASVSDIVDEHNAYQLDTDVVDILEPHRSKQVSEAEITDTTGEAHIFDPRAFAYEIPGLELRTVSGIGSENVTVRPRICLRSSYR